MSKFGEIIDDLKKSNETDDSEWLPVSDLMSGLMILFMFIAISLMLETRKTAESYKENHRKIYEALMQEFEPDLEKMGAEIDPKTLTVIFNHQDVLFETGQSELRKNYRQTLNDFFPRYMAVINKYRQSIEEVRIEGHTSSEWAAGVSPDTAYFENMRLSQDRTRAVLNYVYNLAQVSEYRPWMKEHLAAVGLSSARTIKFQNNQEDKSRSKRVTFRIVTNADAQIRRILEGDNHDGIE